jgi:hypothetical protein
VFFVGGLWVSLWVGFVGKVWVVPLVILWGDLCIYFRWGIWVNLH